MLRSPATGRLQSRRKKGITPWPANAIAISPSPIRRYPDLTIHRLLDAVLIGKKPRNDFGELAVLGEHCSDRERRAEAAERELTKVKLLNYLGHPDRRRDGRRGHRRRRIRPVRARDCSCRPKGLIHVASLQDDYYRYDRASHTLAGHPLGKQLIAWAIWSACMVARVDVDRRELDFRIVGRAAADATPPVQDRPSAGGQAARKRGAAACRARQCKADRQREKRRKAGRRTRK